MSLPTGQPSAGGVVPAGALSAYTSRLLSSQEFLGVRDVMKGISNLMPAEMQVLRFGPRREAFKALKVHLYMQFV